MSKGANAIVGIIRDDVTLTGLINKRVFRNKAPQGVAYPLVIVEEENTDPFPTKSGASSKDHVYVNVFCYAESQSALEALSEACRTLLDEKASGTYNTVVIETIRFQSQNDFDEELENRKVWATDQSYMVRVVR
jgi:hypothetical protein